MSAHYPCVDHYLPTRRSFGGCLPCPQYEGKIHSGLANETWKVDMQSAALAGECIRCLLESGEPFFVGRPGMGSPEEIACRITTGELVDSDWHNLSELISKQRRRLKMLNGVPTDNAEDAIQYARCYAAAINISDVIVRIGGGLTGVSMPLRKPDHVCPRPGSQHHHKVDVLLAHSGHFPARVLSDRGLNPWMIAAYHMTRELATATPVGEEWHLLSRIFAWTRALQGRTVLVVHPFNTSIVSQLRRGSRAIWGSFADWIIPAGIRFKVVAPPQNLARSNESSNWREALDTIIQRVDAAGHFDLAMISCGGLGMLLGAHLLATNRSSMYHGGSLQLWFGVFGHRWE